MKKLFLNIALTAVASFAAAPVVYAGANEQAAERVILSYLPANTGFGKPHVDNVAIDKKSKTITIKCNDATAYIPLTVEQLNSLKKDCLKALGSQYAGYKVKITTKLGDFDNLAFGTKRTVIGPTETDRFVTPLDKRAAPSGLDGANIALWQSHGWYFEPKLNRWEWQRARIFQTVEDLYTQTYVVPFLMPMLENAGAYVMSPRERDVQTVEYIIDNDSRLGYDESGSWKKTGQLGFAHKGDVLTEGVNPFREGSARMAKGTTDAKKAATASWNANIADDGDYAVYVSYQSLPNSATDAIYTVNAADGAHRFKINQQMGGGTWIYLGHFPLESGVSTKPIVELSSLTSAGDKAVVTADAVKIGGGMGNVARIVKEPVDQIDYEYTISGYPRFTEGARYWLQWAGAPDSVYTPTDNVNDYTDDYRSRGLWVNWLAGGSSILPKEDGLKIPVDLSLAFHTDAGTTLNDSIIGTLGIYCTASKDGKYANGTSRLASRDYTDLIMTNIVDDVRATFEPNWTRRGMWDQSYYEARVPQVPAMLLELLSHQNFADMKYGLDPQFRFVVSRAIYKGMLKFLAQRDGRPYVVQPLAVNSFGISGSDGKYALSWQPTPDSLESTAMPTYYIIEERIDPEIAFRPVATVEEPIWTVNVTDDRIHSYRIIAGNDGGRSFPSEVLALCNRPGKPQVMVVNGFTRVSAPDWFDSGEIAGFYDERDHGVPYIQDIGFIGSQFEYRRHLPWMDDDAAGFGASRSNYETKVIAGNTFDYVAVHGRAIRDAGCGFISASADAYVATPAGEDPATVDLIMGKQKEIKQGRGAYGTRFKTFTAPLQDKLRAHTSLGGSVMVSGSYIATDLWDNPNSTPSDSIRDTKFATEVLGYHWRVGQAEVSGEARQVRCRFKAFNPGGEYTFYNTLNPDFYAVESPDSFYAADSKKGCTFMRYSENNLVAGTAYDSGKHRAVAIGFPFETITDPESRTALMKQILDFFGKNK